jgi:hypothetical protein
MYTEYKVTLQSQIDDLEAQETSLRSQINVLISEKSTL